MRLKLIIAIGFLCVSFLRAEKEIYSIKIHTEDKEVFSKYIIEDFKKFLESKLIDSGRLKLDGFPISKVILINIENLHVGFKITGEIKSVQNENRGQTFSEQFDFVYRDKPMHWARRISEKIISMIPVWGKIVSKNDKSFVLNLGADYSIEKGAIFDIYTLDERKVAETIVTTVGRSDSYLKVIDQDGEIEDGYFALLKDETKGTQCSELFVPKILNTNEYYNLRLETRPSNARLFLNGCEIGRSPKTVKRIKLKYNTLCLLAKKHGYKDTTLNLYLNRRWNHKSINLEPMEKYGYLTIHSKPPGAEIWINDNFIEDTTPVLDYKLTRGQHTVKLKLYGYMDKEKQIVLNPNQEIIERIKLREDRHVFFKIQCNNESAAEQLLLALKFYEKGLTMNAVRKLKYAKEYDKKCAAIYYWLGVLMWMENSDFKEAKRNLYFAQKMGLKFDDKYPHPDNLSSDQVSKLIDKFMNRLSN